MTTVAFAALVVLVIILLIILIVILKRSHEIKKLAMRRRREHLNHLRSSSRASREEHHRYYTNAASQPITTEIRPEIIKIETPKPKVKGGKRATAMPTFERNSDGAGQCAVDDSYRFKAEAYVKNKIKLPEQFSAIKQWENQILGVFDQERCGICWSTSATGCFTDRIRIHSKGTLLQDGNYISPWQFASCVKCGVENACPKVCEGNYLDDVFQYLVDHGAVSQFDVDKHTSHGNESICMDYKKLGVKPYKAKRKYRVNILPPGQLNTPENLKRNEEAMMEEIYKHGTITVIIKVYVPNDQRNFYVHQSGVYGYGWKSEPTETDGYHAICIIGWGTDIIDGKKVKYWLIRNSWGNAWASSGFAKVLRGVNFGMIEADAWALEV